MKLFKSFKFTTVLSLFAILVAVFAACEKYEDPAVRPLVTSTIPTDKATNIAVNSALSSTFNVAMDASSITNSTFILKQGATNVSGTATYSGMTASFVPETDLAPNTLYTATITTGVKNTGGTSAAANFEWSFTTGATPDLIMPTVTLTSPAHQETGIALNKTLSVTFSEPIDQTTLSEATFKLNQGTKVIDGGISYSENIATFTPAVALSANTAYTLTVTDGVKDLFGNSMANTHSVSFTTGGTSGTLAPVNLGTSGNYVILAQSAINNSATSAVTGDMAISPAATTYITGFALTDATGYATSTQVTGKVYAADMADPTPINLTTAVGDMVTAYNDAAGRPSPDFSELGTGNIGGKTLTPGLYKWTSTVTMPADLAISGGENDVWIFQISGDLLMSSAVNITLEGGARTKNIFWQVAGQATFGTDTHFEGIILSKNGITLQTRASMNGRALAQKAVILDNNALTKP